MGVFMGRRMVRAIRVLESLLSVRMESIPVAVKMGVFLWAVVQYVPLCVLSSVSNCGAGVGAVYSAVETGVCSGGLMGVYGPFGWAVRDSSVGIAAVVFSSKIC